MKSQHKLAPTAEEPSFSFPWSAKHECNSKVQDGETNDGRNRVSSPVQGMGDNQEMPWETFLESEEVRSVEMRLLRDSWCLLKHLRLDDWVQHAMEAPSAAITVFQSYHNRLSLSLFCYLCRFPAKAEEYSFMAQVSEG